MGEAWRSLKENEKAIYFEKALTEKDVYDKQYAVYKATLGIPGVAAEGEDSDSENDEQKNQNGNGNSSSTIPSIGDIVGDISGSQGAKKKKLNNKGRATNNNSSSSSNV